MLPQVQSNIEAESLQAESLQEMVERFVAAAAEPALLDAGEEPLLLVPGQWNISLWNGRVMVQAWDQRRNLVRKIVGLKEQRRDVISMIVERFPKAQAELQIADLAAPRGRELERRTSRQAFRERFHLMLTREFPEWTVEEVSAEANLEESLSPSYIRGFMKSGSQGIAAIAAPHSMANCAGIVAFGLIWLDYLRRREKTILISRLLMFVPGGAEREAAFRASCIDQAKVACQVIAFDERDRAGVIDFADAGNIESVLPPSRQAPAPNTEIADLNIAGVDNVEQSDGSVSLRVLGLEFARMARGKVSAGIGRRRRSSRETAVAMAREILRLRCAESEDRQHPFYSLHPEGWLEAQIRANPGLIDASLRSAALYGQVPTFSAAERGVIDLLGIDYSGRLAVIEIKATTDLQLPFQALDYWLRVRKHLEEGDFERHGYFAGYAISPEAPRILLVAPALEFHSTTETLIDSLVPLVEVTRIGLAADWRREIRVMFRLRGSERP